MASLTSSNIQDEMQKLMESMGWTDGTFIPIANEENKQLMQTMQQLLTEKETKNTNNQELNKRFNNLSTHLTNAKQDIEHNLKLLDAHRSQLNDEQHMYKLAENDDTSYVKKIKEITNNTFELKKLDQVTQNEVAKVYANMDKLSNKIQWSKMALEEFTQAMARGEETNKLIAKYCKEDEQQAHTLEVKRQAIQTNIMKQRKLLVNASEEQRSLETILDRTAELYRQTHIERRNMVNTWREAVQSLQNREKEIVTFEQEIEKAKQYLMEKNFEFKEQQEFLDRQVENNKEIERNIVELNNEITQLQFSLTETTSDITLKQNELVQLKKLIKIETGQLQKQRTHNRKSQKEQNDKENLTEQKKQMNENLKQKFNDFLNKNLNAQERLKHLDEMTEAEQKTCDAIVAETSRLSSGLYRTQQMLHNWKSEQKVLEMQIKNIETEITSTLSHYKTLEKELIRQTEMVYTIDYKNNEDETRAAKMRGLKKYVDPNVEMRVIQLELLHEDRKQKLSIVKLQVEKIEDDMRSLTNARVVSTKELQYLENILKEKQLLCEGGERDIRKLTLINQERMVDQSLLKMKLYQMDEMVKRQTNKVYNLKKHQADLEMLMNERLIEIKLNKELLQTKRKHMLEEILQLKADISERNLKIKALIVRYENAIDRLGKNDDGSFVTATQIKIETAQEKQILLRDGNELNQKVCKAEKDVKAIENTLVLLNYSNDTYKKTLEPVDENNKEMGELNELNDLYCKALHELKDGKSELVKKTQEVETIKLNQDELEKELDVISKFRLENNDTLMKIHKELLEQKSKMDRAQRELKLARRTAKQKIGDRNYFINFEKDLNLKELEDRNILVLQQLADLVDSVIGMGPIVSKHLNEKGLCFPQTLSRVHSQTSHRSGKSILSSIGGAGGGDGGGATNQNRRDSVYSLKLGSDCSNVSHRSNKSNSSSSSASEAMTLQSQKVKQDGLVPKLVVLDFPGDGCSVRSSASRVSNNSFKK